MLEISFGKNRSDTNWKPEYMEWDEFIELYLKKVRRTNESMAEYDVMSKENRDRIKNGRAFVGGFIKGGRRKIENVENRWLITLDADNANEDFLFTADLILGGYAYAIYSTHSSRLRHLKYRLVLPVDRAMTPDEYGAVSRKIADKIGMTYFDKTTFDVHRLMYLPSCSRDAKPELIIGSGDPLRVDDTLDEYADWHDPSEWPKHPDSDKHITAEMKKLGDPEEKPGVIGTFCKIYSIQDGIRAFIPDVYLSTKTDDRWTYAGGSTFGGMRVYDDKWAYSEHQSDPANDGHCHNIFDLIRIHKYGQLDEDVKEHTPVSKYPSYQEMLKFAINIPEVKVECLKDAQEDFDLIEDDIEDPDAWKKYLDISKKGDVEPTARNAELILCNGVFKNVLAYDAFGNAEVIRGPLPWRERERPQQEYEPWLGSDDNRLLHYFDKQYEFRSERTIKNAFVEVTRRNKFHPIKDYIESFIWDGTDRVDTLFIDYLGANDDQYGYTRQVTRKALLAAIKRIYEPGCKVDEVLVLIGPQGAGKSSILAKLGRKWFSDAIRDVDNNKEVGEIVQSGWIFEIGELSAIKKASLEAIKSFFSKTEDRYRVAYDRVVSDFPRKCVFFGTTNTRDFLKDASGNRRFWPVDVYPAKKKYDHWEYLTDALVGQIWAEALEIYKSGETLELPKEAADEAIKQQSLHFEVDTREGIIQEWLESPIEDFVEAGKTPEYRSRVCAAQIWAECLNNKKGSIRPWEAKEICDIMRRIPGWMESKGRIRVSGYGQQTAFERVKQQ